MVFEGEASDEGSFVALGERDVPEMLALASATEPGPFNVRTVDMGLYFGIRSTDGTLAAMAGERLRADSFTEISAVCTHPEHRGKGYAGGLVGALCKHIANGGRTPILHVKSENGARTLYEKLGFRFRHAIRLTALRRRSSAA